MQSQTLYNLQSPPRTAMEVFELLPEGTLAEVINNTLYMSPAPTYEHQKMLGRLFKTITKHIDANDLGDCVFAPVDVYLGDNVVQPDIVFIAKEKLNIVRNGKINDAPDIIIEVLSENKKHDLVRKKNLYEAFGVKEYFIVDQLTKEVISYYYSDGKFIANENRKAMLESRLLNKTFHL